MTTRYAVYFAPDRHARWREFGATWLGRDEHDSRPLPQPMLEAISPASLVQITQEPARYGFHATLKAPFELAPGFTEADLSRRLKTLATRLHPVALGSLRVTTLGNFVALTPAVEPEGLQVLAAACVTELDDLRAPLRQAERQRRLGSHLDQREVELLDLHGYPHVMDRFRFHMTLTGPVSPAVARNVAEAVTDQVAQLNAAEPLCLDRLCLFVEPTPGAFFHRILDLKLRA